MMTTRDVLAFCESLPGAFGRYPYGPGTLVMTVRETRSFCLIIEGSDPLHLLLKCDPIEAELLRAAYPSAVKPGYHCNKRHWNSVYLDGSIDGDEVRRQIRNSYQLVAGKTK